MSEPPSLEELRRACAERPDSAIAWFNLGNALEGRGRPEDLEEAADAYRRAIDADRELAQPHDRLGRLLLRSGDPAGAAAAFEELSHLQPRFPGVHLFWGHALAAGGDFEGAVGRYRACAASDPARQVPALTAWARLLRERGEVAAARLLLDQVLHEDPYYFLAHAEEGMCFLAEGDRVQGAERLARALEILELSGDPSDDRTWIELALAGARD